MSHEPWRRLITADGSIALSLHRFGPPGDEIPATEDLPEPSQNVVLLSHATGFHAHCYQPLAAALPDDWWVIGVDHRGHGYTAPDPTSARLDTPPVVRWRWFGDDVLTVTEYLRLEWGIDSLIGFGHSMGASALILASAAQPDRFSQLVLFEPIAPSGFYDADPNASTDVDAHDSSLAAGALRRRRDFDSFDAAIENYGSKPPFSSVRAEVLEQYVHHGFAPSPQGITLRCTPAFESATFVGAMHNGTWEAMPNVVSPTIVAAGAPEPQSPGEWAPAIARRLPNAVLHQFGDQTHFGPFTHPEASAELLVQAATNPSV